MERTKKGVSARLFLRASTLELEMISRYMHSLLIYLCMQMIIKYTPEILIYRRPPKLSGDKQRQCHNETRRTYCKPKLRNTKSLPWIRNLLGKLLDMYWLWNSMDMKVNHLIISKFSV